MNRLRILSSIVLTAIFLAQYPTQVNAFGNASAGKIIMPGIETAEPSADDVGVILIDASGGHNIGGGNVTISGMDGLQISHTRWTFRTLDGRAIEFPDYFLSHRRSTRRRFEVSLTEGQKDYRTPLDGADLHDWYKAFTEALVQDFIPTVRGAIGANIRIKPGGVDLIAFYGYKYQIAFKRYEWNPPPPPEPSNNESNESELKASIMRALKKATSEPAVALPPEIDSIDVKVLFGGDPQGEDGTWQNLALIDDLNGDITFPK